MLLELPQQATISEPIYRAAVLVRRRKLLGKPKAPKVYVPKPKLRAPADDHVWAYRADRLRQQPRLTPTEHVKLRCLELRIPFAVMVGPSRVRSITEHRHLLMWELRQRKMSLPAIARIFSRDHTTVLTSCRKIEMEKAQ
ncbi:hypothetical protein B0E45_31635 [Sinorhizobium sp. A49]|uniref:helix-turn-helix domain-containing protein n=1 Tax=Sinorhizobium sp. A49 TaxID=1945861 RepID=UPI000987ACF2|nr:helix-turn-helix domain-containing protein [Sinorhizobium sp. A49]OOG61961.1 hypothetical protein B0E45_31635 [Sinorhizobium sp. A49]